MASKYSKTVKAGFFRRNMYYLLTGAVALVTAATLILVFTLGRGAEIPVVQEPAEELPTVTKPIVFVMPVEAATVGKEYASSKLMWNATLKQWEVHEALDFKAEAGTAVRAAYAGTVASVTTNNLSGTTVTITHDGGLKTVYKSLGETVSVAAGDNVSAGQQIGVVSDSQKTERSEGAHLHFEVYMDNVPIDPATYLPELGDK
ncbi:MAG: M23 family metallopeptidase [Clostridiales bacterium]|jgi:murein DD-endopeptidase MepM/ murein hydrolase activator NlpD|nr:M23 family metallopeptidase [Clostridiales bacterium]